MEESTTSSTSVRARRISFDMAAAWAVIATFALSVFAFIPSVTVPFLYTKVTVLALGALVALALYILARLMRGNVVLPPLPLLGAIWLVPLAYLLSSLFSGAGISTSFFGNELEGDTFGFMVLLSLTATLAALTLRRVEGFRTFFSVAGILALVVLAVQVIFLIVGRVAPQILPPTTNLIGSFIDLGMFLGLGVTLGLLALRFLVLPTKTRTAIFIGGAAALFFLALVNSVLVWGLVALVALGLFIEAIMKNRSTSGADDLEGVEVLVTEDETGSAPSTRSLVPPLVTLAIALFFLIGGNTIGSALATSLGVSVIDVRPSWQSTFDVGSHTYSASPLFGSGPGTFDEQWVKFRDPSLNDTIFWNTDFAAGIGTIPTSFVTTGLAGALAWIAFLALFLFFGIRALLMRLPEDPFMRFVSVASFTGALYVLALAIFTVPGPVVLTAGFLSIGVFISSLRYGTGAREKGIIFARSPRVGFVIVFGLTLLLLASVAAAYVVIERYLSSVAYAESAVALSRGDLEGAVAAADRSLTFSPSDRAYQLLAGIGIARMNQIVSDTSLAPADAQARFQAALSGSIDAAQNATRLGPKDYRNWAMLGNVYQTVVPLNIEGAYENAKVAYDQAVTLNPTSPALPYIVAQLEIANRNPQAANEALLRAITLKRDYTQAIFLLSQLEVQQGRAREALIAAEAAAYFTPNDPVIQFQVGILRSATGNTAGAIDSLSQAVRLNPQYANARFFLGVMYAVSGRYPEATAELEAVAAMSPENARAVEADLAAVRAGRNPFPPSRLGALGIPQAPVQEPSAGPAAAPATAPAR